MDEPRSPSSDHVKRRRLDAVGSSVGRIAQVRPQRSFMTFQCCIRLSRRLFSEASQTSGEQSRRHHNGDAAKKYHQLRLRGFTVQGYLNPDEPSLDSAFRMIDRVGWSYTVLHANPFCPNVVREFLSNIPYNDDGALIRGQIYRFTPTVINQLMMTPSLAHTFEWRSVELNKEISFLTGRHCLGWKGFNLNVLLRPFQTLYRVCELNWIPRPFSDSMMKNRLRLLYAIAKGKEVSFGHLVYDQVVQIPRVSNSNTELIFPNLIYNILVLQRDIPVLPVDEGFIGKGIPILDHRGDTSGPRGSRRLC